jgi:hypothetical protein
VDLESELGMNILTQDSEMLMSNVDALAIVSFFFSFIAYVIKFSFVDVFPFSSSYFFVYLKYAYKI